MDYRGVDMLAAEARDRLDAKDAEINRLRAALKFCGDLAEEEYQFSKIGSGPEIALRHIVRRVSETL